MWTRPWTKAEDAVVLAEYRRGDVPALSDRLRRSRSAVRQRARFLGVDYGRAIDPAAVAELHAAGLCDRDIAAATGFLKRTVWEARTKLGLPPNRQPMSDRTRVKLRRNFAATLARLGVDNLRQLDTGTHARRSAELARRYGLPADLRATQTRIVLALARGPATAKGLCERVGRVVTGDPYHAFNTKYGAGGNHLIDLRRRGLICAYRPQRTGRGGSAPVVYFATLPALRMLSQRGRHAEE